VAREISATVEQRTWPLYNAGVNQRPTFATRDSAKRCARDFVASAKGARDGLCALNGVCF
jgi:hypothetical protein